MPFFSRMFRTTAASMMLAMTALCANAQTGAQATGSDKKTILVVGDSLSAEYGLARGSGWVGLLSARLAQDYPHYRVVNASISGDTTSGGVSRTPALIDRHQPEIFVLELGANDALRGLSLPAAEKNLDTMLAAAKDAGAKRLLIGMQIPPNFGRTYADQFKAIFENSARRHEAVLIPFFFDGIALDQQFFQADGIHPKESAQEKLFDNVWPSLEKLLDKSPT